MGLILILIYIVVLNFMKAKFCFYGVSNAHYRIYARLNKFEFLLVLRILLNLNETNSFENVQMEKFSCSNIAQQ